MPVLYLVACAAPPATSLHEGVRVLRGAGWDVWVTCTPAAAGFVDVAAVAEASGHPVRVESRRAGEPKAAVPPPDAVAVVPLTVNTLAKWALLINDNTAVGMLHELAGSGVPVIAGVWAKEALRAHPRFAEHVALLQAWGVTFLPRGSGYGRFPLEELRAALVEHLP
jgi:phosphopantothenoylcysteine decarboxylase